MSKTLENRILLPSVSTLLTPIVAPSFIITSVVLDIKDLSLLMAWWAERVFLGDHWNFKGGAVTTESPKEAGITIPVPVIITFVGTVNNELRLAD